ncbi:hypothetical protein AC791_10420 [Klebsiella sp. RIT-PI-d]|nr:hypothetical protein AC791_10420 [Klebsiella sp. RIT-PI-d]
MCSRSFGEEINGYVAMSQAIFCRAGHTVVMEDEAGEVVTQLYDAVVRFTARMGEMTIRERSYCSFRMVYSGPAYAGLWSAMSEERKFAIPTTKRVTLNVLIKREQVDLNQSRWHT